MMDDPDAVPIILDNDKLFDAVVERKLDPASAATEILEQLGD